MLPRASRHIHRGGEAGYTAADRDALWRQVEVFSQEIIKLFSSNDFHLYLQPGSAVKMLPEKELVFISLYPWSSCLIGGLTSFLRK